MIKIREYKESDQKIWDEINLSAPYSTFVTSNDWIEFQIHYEKSLKFYRYIIELDKDPIGIWAIKVARRRISQIAFSPSGPTLIEDGRLMIDDERRVWEEIRKFCVNFCKEQGLNLFKIEPQLLRSEGNILGEVGFKPAFSMGGAKDTWQSDISIGIEEFSKQLKKDTRYYVNRGRKVGIKVRKASSIEDVKKLGALMKETTERKGFHNHSSKYFEQQWEELNPKSLTEIYIAELDGKPLAGALINFYRDTAYYAHGASTSDIDLQKLAAPYILHFEIIKDIMERGIKKYNWWGIVPKGVDHPYRGLSDFKMKFPGEHIEFVGPHEVYSNFIQGNLNRIYDWWTYRKDRY